MGGGANSSNFDPYVNSLRHGSGSNNSSSSRSCCNIYVL